VQIALLIFSLAATVILPLLFFLNLKRIKPWLGVTLMLGGVAFLILDFFLADAVVPGIVDAIFGSIQLILVALGLCVLWYLGFRNMLKLLGRTFWLWLGGAVVIGFLLGILSSGASPLDQLVVRSQLFGDYLRGLLGSSPEGRVESVEVRVATFVLLFGGILAGVGLGLGGRRSANRRQSSG
jgi:hypothetical protein